MFVIRPITKNDTEGFIKLAFEAGIGMTSMPKNREALSHRVEQSLLSFCKDVQKPSNENYLFVLEELKSHHIGGTCGILAKTATNSPIYFYRLETIVHDGPHYPAPQKIPLMRVVHYYDAPTEICSLYLSPDYRREGMGRLLSLSRFLFMASFPERFDKMVYAEMRGYIEENLSSPFWESIGRHFIDLDFTALMHLRDEGALNSSQVLPTYPIYLSLLPKNVQDIIGKVHVKTRPALNMLIQEGFYLTEEIDIFDGGPKIEAETKEIRTIKESILNTVAEIAIPSIDSHQYIISNNKIDFRACYAQLEETKKGAVISAEVAEALKIQQGDAIRYVKGV